MSFEIWLAFAAASAVLLALPGPTVLLVVSYSLSHGRRAMLATVAGVALGDFTAMTLSMLGLGALLAASATLFTAVKWAGAAYLVYLGIMLWRAPVPDADAVAEAPSMRPWRMLVHMWMVTTLNPKSLVFFVAFLPQFVDPGRPFRDQILVMGATFVAMAAANAALYGLLASRVRGALRRPTVRRTVNRVGGTALVSAGALTAS
ncbi:LysE family translocator [Azospirillum halopraeferens]|uniref:LysE family translocator n=1 Tax=Azospirillum halopraeferens TaxID=34010 RepID=UPI00041FE336|nr:LysE family translocator [Azospirillum halopraeferens]